MRLLLVFLKEPLPGKVKTRLAADIGDDEAVRYYKAMVEVLLRQLQGLNNCRIRFCYAPDDAGDAIRFWLLPEMQATSSDCENLYVAPTTTHHSEQQEIDFRPQGNGNLGDRLNRAFDEGFADGFEKIAVIGTDCPSCGARWINAAFSRLEADTKRDGVIGPCLDGGYYLLALKSPAPSLFQDIPWSGSDVLTATLQTASEYGLTLEQLPPLADVDHLDDWNTLLTSPLGAAIRKALGEKLGDDDPLSVRL